MELLMNGGEALQELGTLSEMELVDTMHRAAGLCIRGEGVDPARIELSLSFVSPEEIHRLNRDFRGVDRVTDVLSFPQAEDLEELPALPACQAEAAGEAGEKMGPSGGEDRSGPAEAEAEEEEAGDDPAGWLVPLGDVVICLDQARAQAAEYGHSDQREILYLFVHSILHLLGYDHIEEGDKQEMRAREEEVLAALKVRRD